MDRRAFVLAALLTLVACKNNEAKKVAPAAPVRPDVEIVLDDKPVATVSLAQAAQWPRLESLLPPDARRVGMWQMLTAASPRGPLEIKQPSATHPDLVAALYPGINGTAFGLFDPVELAKKGAPAIEVQSVTQLRIVLDKAGGRGENEHGGGGGGEPAPLALAIKTKAGAQTLPGDKLLALPREPAPGNADSHAGWRLLAVLEAAGVKSPKRLLLTGASGTNLTLEEQDLDPAKAIPFLKLNRQGALRFRVFYKEGETWQMRGDLRGLTSVEVLQ